MRYGLSNISASRILNVLASIPAIERAVLYGSRARGNYHNGSDIDMTLEGPTLTFSDLCLVYNRLDELMLPYHFDLSIKRYITNEALLSSINEEGCIFFKRQASISENPEIPEGTFDVPSF